MLSNLGLFLAATAAILNFLLPPPFFLAILFSVLAQTDAAIQEQDGYFLSAEVRDELMK